MDRLKYAAFGAVALTLVNSVMVYVLLALGFTLTEQLNRALLFFLPLTLSIGGGIGWVASYVARRPIVLLISTLLGWWLGLGIAAASTAWLKYVEG